MTTMNFSFCEFLRKFPDVSRIPNLKKLDLDYCKNLVEVHPSVGFLEKLVSLRLEGCSNLKSFPRSLKMRSLKILWLRGCSRIKNFPKIECPMECLEEINFNETGIDESPSSIGYLVGVETLYLSGCTNLMNLPDSILKLQHFERLYIGELDGIINLLDSKYLSLSGCSKVDELLKTVEDTRQSMPTVVSIEESATSSMAELLQLSPPTNTSGSNDGSSSIVFPKLRKLDLHNCVLSKSNSFKNFDWFSELTLLDLSMSDIVALPPSIRRFVKLKFLYLRGCKQLREILGFPPNVIFMTVEGCVSLAMFLEQGRRSQLFNAPETLFQVGTVFPALILGNHVRTESDFLIQPDFPSSLEHLYLSGSAIVNLPVWLHKFVGLKRLYLAGCKQLGEIPKLPTTLDWIDLSNCHRLRENMGDNLEIRLMSEVPLFYIHIC